MEETFLRQLLANHPDLYCRYQTFRIHFYLRKAAFKRVDPFELYWDKDDCGRFWLVGGRIFSIKDDEDERELAAKIQQRTSTANEYVLPIKELLNERLGRRLEQAAFGHFARVVDVAATLGLDAAAALHTLLPDGRLDPNALVRLTADYLQHLAENDASVPFEHELLLVWATEVYPRLYADAIDGNTLNDMHGKQFDKHLPMLLAAYNKRICSRFPSLSYLLSSKSENAYKKAKIAQKDAVKLVFRINKDTRSKSLASLNNSRIFGGGESRPLAENNHGNSRVKFVDLAQTTNHYKVNSR